MSDDRKEFNYSELNTLAQCEQRWVYGYARREEETGARVGLKLGTLLHIGYGMWLAGAYAYADTAWLPREWVDDMGRGGKPGELQRYYLHDFEPDVVSRALWLLARFVAHYGSTTPSSWNVIASEKWMAASLYGNYLVGRPDGLVEIEGESDEADGLWLIEAKSYGSKGRLDYIAVDPQLVIYKALVEQNYNREIKGVLYEGMYTYQWKPEKPTQAVLIAEAEAHTPFTSKTLAREWARKAQELHPGLERPVADSFERRFVDLTEEHVERGMQYVSAAAGRRRLLYDDPTEAIPNVGHGCRSCGFRTRCWSELGGVEEPEDPEIELSEMEPV